MPTYQYACTACGHQLEAVQAFSDEPLTVCPACEGRLRKVFSAVGIVFKGSGFYRTDSRADKSGEKSSPAKESSTSESSSTSAATSSSGSTDKSSASGNGGSGSSTNAAASTSTSSTSSSSSASKAAAGSSA